MAEKTESEKPKASPAPWYIQYRCWLLAAIAAILAIALLASWWRGLSAAPAPAAVPMARGGRRWKAGGGCGCVLP